MVQGSGLDRHDEKTIGSLSCTRVDSQLDQPNLAEARRWQRSPWQRAESVWNALKHSRSAGIQWATHAGNEAQARRSQGGREGGRRDDDLKRGWTGMCGKEGRVLWITGQGCRCRVVGGEDLRGEAGETL
jgi:hypothetical protein